MPGQLPERTTRPTIGLLGGTFDPPHIGHLVVADQVRDRLGLDEVRLVVANEPWQKVDDRRITPARVRLELVEAAVSRTPGVTASGVELDLGGPSYTLVTLEALSRSEPGVQWLVIVGADAATGLDTWHRAEELRRRHRFAVVSRPGHKLAAPPGWDCQLVRIPSLELSSTELRALVAEGRSIRHLTPEPVVQLLAARGLYRRR